MERPTPRITMVATMPWTSEKRARRCLQTAKRKPKLAIKGAKLVDLQREGWHRAPLPSFSSRTNRRRRKGEEAMGERRWKTEAEDLRRDKEKKRMKASWSCLHIYHLYMYYIYWPLAPREYKLLFPWQWYPLEENNAMIKYLMKLYG